MIINQKIKYGPCKLHSQADNSTEVQMLLQQKCHLEEESVLLTTSLCHNGLTFKPHAFVFVC